MATIPAGSIELNDARTETSRAVTVLAFQLSATAVTWDSYRSVVGGESPSPQPGASPVHSVSWWDAVRWCNAASRAHGLTPAYVIGEADVTWDVSADGFRLPTEAEWERACRAGTAGPRYGPLAEIAWTEADGVEHAQVVATKLPNSLGLYDMLGNVWEWCWDHLDPARYADYRVLRGGGWADPHWSVRASVRRGSTPGARLDDLGFRVARGAVGDADDQAAQGWSAQADEARARATSASAAGWTSLLSDRAGAARPHRRPVGRLTTAATSSSTPPPAAGGRR
jgi:formylglycine-generating enzyme